MHVEDSNHVSANLHAEFVFFLEVAELALASVGPELCVLGIVSELRILVLLVTSTEALSLILL